MSRARRAGTIRPAAGYGVSELDRACGHLQRAVTELKAARQAWGCWADGVRQQAEDRLGVTDLRDQRVMDDLEYGRALDLGTPVTGAVDAAEAVERVEPGLPRVQQFRGLPDGNPRVGRGHPGRPPVGSYARRAARRRKWVAI